MHQEYVRDAQHFCTVIFGLLIPERDGYSITLASGGHPDLLLIRADGTASYQLLPGGIAIGVLDDTTFTPATIRDTAALSLSVPPAGTESSRPA
ncbi:MAG: SpoIIE family protein phosphatase [Streptosporangiaceae bacterium]